ncbi:secreted serine protease [Tirmania nivea]|nr:secreted serine protease [Tirmania nivea]
MQLSRSLAVLAAALFPILGTAAPAQPVEVPPPRAGETIPDSYIVLLKEGISQEKFEAHQRWAQQKHESRLGRRDDSYLNGVNKGFVLSGLYGYQGTFDRDTLAEIIQSDEVDYAEEDQVVMAYDMIIQHNPPSWGLPRISKRRNNAREGYAFDSSAGKDVNVYVLDTGVNIHHRDFEGRASWGTNVADQNNRDSQGHGTHVSGTIAGASHGVAKRANIIAVKVLGDNGTGSTSKLISGIEWTIAHARSSRGGPGKSVVNMSLGGGYSNAVNRAVEAATAQGLTFVVAAGNDGKDARNYSPASSPHAITVGATQQGDGRASYSNYGAVVDVFAPGSQIVSTWYTSNSTVHTLSGTSMASPHVAGLAAYLIAQEGLSGSAQVTQRIMNLAQRGVVGGAGPGSPNAFIWNGAN